MTNDELLGCYIMIGLCFDELATYESHKRGKHRTKLEHIITVSLWIIIVPIAVIMTIKRIIGK